jgi:hypothetical protein
MTRRAQIEPPMARMSSAMAMCQSHGWHSVVDQSLARALVAIPEGLRFDHGSLSVCPVDQNSSVTLRHIDNIQVETVPPPARSSWQYDFFDSLDTKKRNQDSRGVRNDLYRQLRRKPD